MAGLKDYIKLIRPHHYIKNLLVFAPLFFGLEFFNSQLFLRTALAFLYFSFAASGVYILNDYFDIEGDSLHPLKKNRPLASGKIFKKLAIFLSVLLSALGLLGGALLSINIFYILLAYVFLNLCYSFKLKHFAIIDVLIVSMGYIMRLLVGAESAKVSLSSWIIIITFFVAMFISFAKRREDVVLSRGEGKTRKSVTSYTLVFLNFSMAIMASAAIFSYVMYTISPIEIAKIHSNKLYLTSILVVLGILRYAQVVLVENKTCSPTKIFAKDRIIQTVFVVWIISFGILLYL